MAGELLNPDHAISTRHDPLTDLCHYVFLVDGEFYTVSVPLAEFDRFDHSPAGKINRRGVLLRAMRLRFAQSPDPKPKAEPAIRQES